MASSVDAHRFGDADSSQLRTDLRRLDGRRMQSAESAFDEFSAVFEFPDYFGKNWAALDECLADLSWIGAPSYLVIIECADSILADDGEELPTLLRLLDRVARDWAEPVTLGEAWDRPAVPFVVILGGPSDRIERAARENSIQISSL